MSQQQHSNGEGMTRNRFLRFLGRAGLLSLIPGTAGVVDAGEGSSAQVVDRAGRAAVKLRVRSPLIKGKRLTDTALTAKLSTPNLENIRDMITGRFFGRAAEEAFNKGYTPLINWDLGTKGSTSGCFFFAVLTDPKRGRPAIDNCGLFTIASESGRGKLLIDVLSSPGGRIRDLLGGGACALVLDCTSDCSSYCCSDCASFCSPQCEAGYCGVKCSPKAELDLAEIVSYPGDKFASELTKILGTTDVGRIQRELRQVIFSDEALSLGLDEFLRGAQKGLAGKAGM